MTLQVEQLEPRHMLSGMDISLEIDETELLIGNEYELRVYAEDMRGDPQGVFAAAVDVSTESNLEFVSVVAGDLWLAEEAEVYDTSTAHLAGIDPDPAIRQLVGVLTVRALESGSATISTANDSDELTHNLLLGMDDEVTDITWESIVVDVRYPFTASNGTDVNRDGITSVLDVTALIEDITENGLYQIPFGGPESEWAELAPDVNGDGHVTALDLLHTVNYLTEEPSPSISAVQMWAELFEDSAGGVPGDPIPTTPLAGDYAVDLGSKFWVAIMAVTNDLDPDVNDGIDSSYINLEWYHETIQNIWHPVEDVIAPSFLANHTGQLVHANVSSAITDLGASVGAGGAIGDGHPAVFAMLQFEAVGIEPAGLTPIWMSVADGGITTTADDDPLVELFNVVIRVELQES